MCHDNDRLINLAAGAVVVIVFLLIGRLKRSLRNTPVAADVLGIILLCVAAAMLLIAVD